MNRSRLGKQTTLLIAGLLSACAEPAPPAVDPIEKQLDIQTEVMHQTREVIRYMDEEERIKQELLNPSAAQPPERENQ
ncbi:hypothetical protein [Sedimenticola selenatireducens]|uniref:Lipoprotein n=1 Tax=Sedimenticola selenatireducens TaxID=191960 RepID=A0A557S4Z8_9GAMM|nr:hypothetical protein [Sedimenticola selenatireducens]TVO72483.1 hypothetical protein FHP88_12885 [Sedimenticola selenatireducens]TVT64738.1 MAG: hypothetical protein FHK78_06650 [Sedimenticola selenatireducens]